MIESHIPDSVSSQPLIPSERSEAAVPSQSIGARPKRSDARPISAAPTSASPERSDVCPPWHSASQPSASRRVCMKGKVTADELTAVKMAIERSSTPRCGGGLAPFLAESALSELNFFSSVGSPLGSVI